MAFLAGCEGGLLDRLEAEQAHAVVRFVAEQLRAERHVEKLLPWLDDALRLRARGRDLFEPAVWRSLSRTLRGLSASADASGIFAAKLFALLQAAPPGGDVPPPPGSGSDVAASGGSAVGPRLGWLD